MNIDQTIDAGFTRVADFVESIVFYAEPFTGYDIKLILVWLVALSLFLTFYFGFINIRYFKHAIDVLRGKFDAPNSDGQINRFQALSTSLSGTVGLGNIAGVAVAVSIGGPGAVFWMAMMGLFGMTTKFAEAALGVKYREHRDPNHPESISGGPMYYLRHAFGNTRFPMVGKAMAGLFALCCLAGCFGAGSMFQANQAFRQFVNVTGGDAGFFADKGWLVGAALAVMVGVVIIGGLKSIAKAASRIVPLMGGIYLVAGLVVIIANVTMLPEALVTIVRLAVAPEAGFGAVVGALLMGVQRAAFSNEAGLGSAAIVHATAKTDEPVSQGFVGMLGPFIDTLVICMITALVIVITGAYEGGEGIEGVVLTSRAFETVMPWFPYLLAFIVFLFAYSTMISWSYYGLKGAKYLFGEKPGVEIGFKVLYCLSTIIGASAALDSIIRFTDSMVFTMAIPNAIGLYMLAPELKKDIKKYLESIKNKDKKEVV